MKLELRPGCLRDIRRRLDHLDRQKRCTLVNWAECPLLILVPLAKHLVGIDVMLTSDQRHGGARLEPGLDDLAFEVQREVGTATGSTGGSSSIQDSVH
jgi:hypothetical protein